MWKSNKHRANGSQSKFEVLEDGRILMDFATAHQSIGDNGYEKYIPQSCKKCEHQAVERSALGFKEATQVDQPFTADEIAELQNA